MTTLYHGSRDGLAGSILRAGTCLTRSRTVAERYGDLVYEVTLDLPPLATEAQVRATLAEEGVTVGRWLYETIDEQIGLLGEHWDAIRYMDCDPQGCEHEAIRLLVDVPATIRRLEE